MCLGIPGRITEIIDPETMTAMVEVGGVRRPINVSFIVADGTQPSAYLGEWVLVHVGFAMSHIDAAEAERTLALLTELGEMQAEVDVMQQTGETGFSF
ncbi:HypC/HybG/HupF family hydrogenase formation chaperone [Rhodopila sp.]|uniref:HypC/HybG/HupF family hydrogenase formation chaperone n=1 Tax=Rhodopila sp. TaxID=2480087 RepID=UPI003D137FBA